MAWVKHINAMTEDERVIAEKERLQIAMNRLRKQTSTIINIK
jgi:hypothetical protein